jgi:DNA-binding MarR family transcriptional regulator
VPERHPIHDDVDEIVDAWRRERPDLDPEPMHVMSRISRLARRLDLDRSSAFARHGMDGWEFDVLSTLRRAGPPYELSPGDLVRATLVTSGTMTNRIDRLTARGWVERAPSPRDRRSVIVRLTDDGRTAVDAALADLLERERDILADLGPGDQADLVAQLRRLLAPFEG